MTTHICFACHGTGCDKCLDGIIKMSDDAYRTAVTYSGYLTPFPSEDEFGRRAWMLTSKEKKDGKHILIPILAGDFLTIEDQGVVIFCGTIVIDSESGQQPHPGNRSLRSQKALEHWIPWTQKGVHPDIWAGFFIRETPLLAVLSKNSDEGYL